MTDLSTMIKMFLVNTTST